MKASLQMLLLAAFAALALVAHKGSAGSSSRTALVAENLAPPPAAPRQLHRPTTLDDGTVPDPLVSRFEVGRSQQPVMFRRPTVPVFTDIGQQADLPSSHFGAADSNVEGQVAAKEITTEVPLAGVMFQVADLVLGGGNAAGVSPQQLAYINTQVASGVSPGRALALAEGRLGTKQIIINGEYVTIGGRGLGGPGFSEVAAETTSADDTGV